MNLEDAIQKAIKEGWDTEDNQLELSSIFLLDPNFWQCLGKSMGWGIDEQPDWKFRWHELIDHLIYGYDIESFFEKL